MLINNENLESKMFEIYAENKDWIKTYQVVKESVDSAKEYCSVKLSLTRDFIYYLIKNKSDLEGFSKFMSYLYQNSTTGELGSQLNSFFNTADVSLSLFEYSQLNKHDNQENMADQIGYLFLNWDKNKPQGKNIQLDKANLPYLLAMANEVTDDTVGVLWYAGYSLLIRKFVHNLEEIKPLIDMAQSNEAFSFRKEKEHGNFFDNIGKAIADNAIGYELYPNESRDIYKTLLKIVPNIDELLAKSLFKKSRHRQGVELDVNLLDFFLKNEPELDTVSIIDKKYKELYHNIKSQPHESYQDLKRLEGLSSEFGSSISVAFSDYDITLDFSKVDISKDFRENYIYLKLIEEKIQNKQKFDISIDVATYIVASFENEDKSIYENDRFSIENVLDPDVLLPYLKKTINYKNLEKSVKKKPVVKNKMKV